MWIFGYGSLIWRPGFSFRQKKLAKLPGWQRRFSQKSIDHRGTFAAPGRVVTLEAQMSAECWGVAFQVAEKERPQILDYLDEREKGGYNRAFLELDIQGMGTQEALTYIASPENPNYAGPSELKVTAEIILQSHGPSGSNLEYLLQLHDALRAWEIDDPYVKALVSCIQNQLQLRRGRS